MPLIGSIANVLLLASIVLGPILILILGARMSKLAFIAMLASGTLAMPFAAVGRPDTEAGTDVILTFVFFAIGLAANGIASAIRTPRPIGRGKA